MSEENKKVHAAEVMKTLCDVLARKGISSEKTEDGNGVHFSIDSGDFQIFIMFKIDADEQVLKIYSPLPFAFDENKRLEGAIAVNGASFGMAMGNFDYNLATGEVTYRNALCFENSEITDERIDIMLNFAILTVDKYNDKFYALKKGIIDVTEFVEK